jgi:hypothetical protein
MASALVEIESFSLNAIVGSLALTASLSWLDFVRSVVGILVKVPRDTSQFFLVTALLTTLLSVVVYMVIKAAAKNVEIKKPGQIYALTR